MIKRNKIQKSDDQALRIETLVSAVRELILEARKFASRSVDILQVHTSFEIGRCMIEHEQEGSSRAGYGKEILNTLAERLTTEFGRGFSRTNLAYMRKFYLLYRDRLPEIVQIASGQLPKSTQRKKVQMALGQLAVREPLAQASLKSTPSPFALSWSQYIFLLGVKNDQERAFYEIESAKNGWALPELKRQFNAGLYERLSLSRDKDGIRKLAQEGQVVTAAQDLLKEPYVLEFLGLDQRVKYSESELETSIIDKLEHFLLELGKGFLFEARQKRFTFDEEHFFVDLVLYNRLLRCYVLVDLKIGKLTHQDLGQIQMYVNYFDRFVKTEDENSTIGIILCKKKHDALVEITLPRDANIHAREYQLYLPSKEALQHKLIEWIDEQDVEK